MADDARTTYLDDRTQEDAATQQSAPMSDEAVLAAMRQRLIASGKLTPEGLPAAPADASGAPAADGSAAPGGDPNAPDPNLMQPEPLPAGGPTSLRGKASDVRNSAVIGPLKAAANVVDFGARALDGTLEYLGVDPATFSSGTATGDLVDSLYQPETTAGQITRDVTGALAGLYVTGSVIGGAGVTAVSTSDKAPNLSNLGASQPADHWANNWATQMLAIENDDTGFQKFLKRFGENLIINGVTDKVVKTISAGLTRVRARKLDKGAIASSAAEQGMKPDDAIDAIIDEGVVAKNETEALDAIRPTDTGLIHGPDVQNPPVQGAATITESLKQVDAEYKAAKRAAASASAPASKKAALAKVKEIQARRDTLRQQLEVNATSPKIADRPLAGTREELLSERRRLYDTLKNTTDQIEIDDIRIQIGRVRARIAELEAGAEPIPLSAVQAPTAPKAASTAPDPNTPSGAAVAPEPAAKPAAGAPEATPSAPAGAPKPSPAAPASPARLPKELSGAKPRWGIGASQYKPQFASDVDKAAYITAQKTRSKADAKYLQWGMDATGMTEAEFRAHGVKVREAIKRAARGAEPGDIQVPALWEPGRPKVGGEPVPTKPVAAAEAVNPNTPSGAANAPEPAAKAAADAPAGAPAAAADAAPESPAVAEAVTRKVAAGKAAELDRTERLTRAFETSTSDPAVLKAQKEAAVDAGHVFTPEQAARVDAAITARVKAVAPEIADRPFGAHLTITKTHLNGIRSALLAGDFHGATGILGEIIGDTTNFNKIVESGDITDLLAALASEFSKDENSFRILARRSREATFSTAEAELEALAKEYGTDANAIRLGLEKQLPGRDLTKTLTAYRMLEVALADRANKLAIEVTSGGSKSAKAELARTIALTAIVNDRRAGTVSDIARALNSLQKQVDVPKGVVLRAAAAQARMMGLDEFINSVGGGDRNITRLAEMITSSDDPIMIAKLTKKASKMLSGTLGDALYAFVIHNTLSGPLSAIKNVTSSAFYQGVWKSFSNLSGAAARDAHSLLNGRDAYAFRKEWIRVQATRAAARKVFAQDSIIRRNMKEAWVTGQRVTTPGGAFMEHLGSTGKVTRLGEGNMARATELARTLRAGGQFKIPFGDRVNLGASLLGQGRLNKLADALDSSAQTRRLWSPMSSDPAKEIAKRYGYAAKVIDYVGRVNSWPMHALATGDELNASIARSAALEAEAFEAVRGLKLSQADSEAYIRDVIENIEDIPKLQAKAAEGTLSAEAVKRLSIMEDIAAKADDYVRQVTFTEAPGTATQVIAHARTAIPGARWMLFFVRTPGNIARAGVRESPLGRVGMAAGAAINGRGADAAEQLGRAAFASAVALGGWEMVTNGNMTGSGPSDREANQLWRDEGNQPYTARLDTPAGPIVLNYGSYFDPVAIPLQVMADLVEASDYMDDETHASLAEEFSGRLMNLLESKSYLGSLVDMMDLISGRGSREKAVIRVMKNFVPQSRLLATLRTNGLPVPAGVAHGIFGKPDPNDEVMSLADFINGRGAKGLVDRGKGVKLNEKGELVDIHGGIIDSPFVVHLVSDVAEDLPPGFAESWLEFHAKVLGVRAQHGKFVQRDQLGEKRMLPIGYGPQTATGLMGGQEDPVRQELIDVGMDKDVNATFGQFLGQELTPEQQDYYQRRYRRPVKGMPTAYEMFQSVIQSKDYQTLGETVGSIKGGRAKVLESHHKNRMDAAQAMLLKKFPELRAVLMQRAKQKAQMMTKEGSDAFAAERAARAPALIQAFKEATDGSN